MESDAHVCEKVSLHLQKIGEVVLCVNVSVCVCAHMGVYDFMNRDEGYVGMVRYRVVKCLL